MDIVATEADRGLRVDVWLSQVCEELSRSRVQALIREGHILVDGQPTRAHAKVAAGTVAHVSIPAPVAVDVRPEDIPLDILFEDHDIIVVNKPAGLVVHPAPGHASGTLVNALLWHCRDLRGIGGELRPGIVHRLDKDTSGVMVVAKHAASMGALMEQFKHRAVRKTYAALVWGMPQPTSGRIETTIGRSENDRKKMSTRARVGRLAISNYEVEAQFGSCALVRVQIETGRTHQIRVHMAHMGHGVVGDPLYGRSRSSSLPAPALRQMLHARVLEIAHPSGGDVRRFEAPLPDDFQALLSALQA